MSDLISDDVQFALAYDRGIMEYLTVHAAIELAEQADAEASQSLLESIWELDREDEEERAIVVPLCGNGVHIFWSTPLPALDERCMCGQEVRHGA